MNYLRPKNNAAREHYRNLFKQHAIDGAKIQVALDALDKGIPLENNHLYDELMKFYPEYKKTLKDRMGKLQELQKQ